MAAFIPWDKRQIIVKNGTARRRMEHWLEFDTALIGGAPKSGAAGYL